MTWRALFENPHGDAVNAIVRKAGWSFDLAMEQLKSDGAARERDGLLYVLTDAGGDTIPSDPREPMIVGVYALDERAGEWVEVGMENFPNLRSALRRWNTVQVDTDEVDRIADENVTTDEDRSRGPRRWR